MDPRVGAGYKSRSQIARRVTEDWASRNLYCANCASTELVPARPGAPVLDFHCPECTSTYQLKSQGSPFGRTVHNSAYGKKIEAILAGRAPHYAFLHYSPIDWQVKGLFLVPGHFFTPALIRMRAPLKATARRAGWVGSNILLGALSPEARVPLVASGAVRDVEDVRADWNRFRFLREDARARGGWGAAVLSCVRDIVQTNGQAQFTLQQFYGGYSASLSAQFQDNRHVEAKVRQQLQVLRDAGVLSFMDNRGLYEVIA